MGQYGRLYRLELTANHQPGIWSLIGTPPGKVVKSVAVEILVLITTSDSEIWRLGSVGFVKLGKVTNKAIAISKPFRHTCQGSSVLMAIVQTFNRLFAMKIQSNAGHFTYIGHNNLPFSYLPAVLQNPKCPKVFTVASNGDMVEFFV